MKSIVCFGTGIDGRAFISVAENKFKIEYFLDNVQSGQIGNYKLNIFMRKKKAMYLSLYQNGRIT